MSASSEKTSKSGIVTDSNGQRHIPASVRADGSQRKEIKVRPGYRPPEDVEVYRTRRAEAVKSRGKPGVPGAEPASDEGKAGTAASNKNAKRREARRKAKESTEESGVAYKTEGDFDGEVRAGSTATAEEVTTSTTSAGTESGAVQPAQDDAEVEKEKKAKKLRKKLREARDLQQKKERGEGLLPEQLQKAIRINELIRELDQLGLGAEEEAKTD